jgi:hypothetical protein
MRIRDLVSCRGEGILGCVPDADGSGGLSADDDPATTRLPVRVPVGGVGLGRAGGEQAEVVGQGAVGEVGDTCAKDGDCLGR